MCNFCVYKLHSSIISLVFPDDEGGMIKSRNVEILKDGSKIVLLGPIFRVIYEELTIRRYLKLQCSQK